MSSCRHRRRFDLIELCCIVLLASVASWVVGQKTLIRNPVVLPSEAESLAAAYGPGRYSQFAEEWIIRDFFKDRRGGFFVDIGANHYRTFNTTFYLETQLDWSGIAVDPQKQFEADYTRYRPRTHFFPLFVSNVSNEEAKMYVLEGAPLVASATKDFTEQLGKGSREVSVSTITLSDLLDQLQVRKVDLVSIDVELSEPKVLAGFDIERFKPAFVCIEAQREVRQQILDYFTEHRYVAVGRYLRADANNLYFAPLR